MTIDDDQSTDDTTQNANKDNDITPTNSTGLDWAIKVEKQHNDVVHMPDAHEIKEMESSERMKFLRAACKSLEEGVKLAELKKLKAQKF